MNSSIYRKLALTNLKNNRKTYVPYILTAVLSVMMFYIMSALAESDSISYEAVRLCLDYATVVLMVFSVIFLFYTNSFLIKRRKKEIGVYNILGMGKRHIAKMMMVETLITASISIVSGLVLGVIFSKLMYLVLLRLLHYDVGMKFEILLTPMIQTVELFVVIFVLTLIYNLMQIKLANPIELLHGSKQGEKEPKTKWLLTVFGILMLGIGYVIALTTESPLTAIFTFFVAVVCVVLGTYALFIAGSVAFFKMLRKNKKFYYKAKHFTSVSGMIYRMKQNAVGLANICILSTMVLVMISTTVCLYVGMEDVLQYRFPYEFSVTNYGYSEESEEKINQIIKEEIERENVSIQNGVSYHYGALTAVKNEDWIELQSAGSYGTTDVCEFFMIPQEDYNQMEGESVQLASDEVILYITGKNMYGRDTLKLEENNFRIVKELEDMKVEKKNGSRYAEAFYVVFSSEEQIQQLMNEVCEKNDVQEEWQLRMNQLAYKINFDLKGDEDNRFAAAKNINNRVWDEVEGASCDSRELSRESFYMLYGGFLFIGIYLGFMFLMVTVLIIYYKQISEGYDDRERYQIMQQVGMDKREVKRSIRSQVLLVFFLPLAAAVLHITVAFKVITKLLAVLNMVNVPLYLTCTAVTVVVFAVFYIIVFTLTEREYYRIVN